MCFSSSRWWACRAGAAVESGRMFPSDVNHAPLHRKGACTLDQLVALRPVLQPLLQAVGDLLALELLLDGL